MCPQQTDWLHYNASESCPENDGLFRVCIVDTPQIPSNIFLAQLRPSIYIPACMAVWGIVSTCTGAVQSAGGLYAARFILGFVEACFYPGAIFLLSSWYKRSELGVRCAYLYSGSQVGSAISGLIAAGITEGLDGARGLRAWRWIFVRMHTSLPH